MRLFARHIYKVVKVVTEVVDTIGFRPGLRPAATVRLYRNALYLMLNTVVTSLLGFFFWMVVARFYSGTEVGFGSAIIAAINLVALLSMVGLNFSIIRFLSQADRPQKLINVSFTLSGLISLLTATAFIAGLDFWSPALSFIRQNAIFALTFLVIVVLSTSSNLMDSVFIAKLRTGLVLSKNTILSVLKLPLLVALTIYFHTFGVVVSWGIALGMALAISVFVFLPRVEAGYRPVPTLNLGHLKGIRRYSGSSYLASLLSRAPVMMLPLMVVNLLGTESNAYFYVAWMIASSLFAIPRSVSQSLFAEGSHSEVNIRAEVKRSVKFTFQLLVPAVTMLMVVGKWILLAFGESYSANALTLLWVLNLANLPRGISQVYISLLRVQNRLKELVIIRGFMAVAVLALSALIMPVYGIIGIGYVWLGLQGGLAILLVLRLGTQVNRFSRSGGDDWVDANNY